MSTPQPGALPSAIDLIEFGQTVDYLDQGRQDLIADDALQGYARHGLLQQEGRAWLVTPAGRAAHEQYRRERSAEG